MSFTVSKEVNGVRVTIYGVITPSDLIECNHGVFRLDHLETVRYCIWDASKVTEVRVCKTDSHQNAALDAISREGRIPDGLKLALISCDSELDPIIDEYINTMKMLNSSWDCRRFHDLASAEQWACI